MFNMEPSDYTTLLAAQGGGCAICGATTSGDRWNGHLHIDHDHKTGTVRGLLCQKCNQGLGWFKHEAKLLQAAAKYLRTMRP
jgi:hypothetical protein